MNSARSFRQPCGVGGEFDNVVYARDEIVGTVKIISLLIITNTVKFLSTVGDVDRGFSVRDQSKAYETCNLKTASGLVHNCRVFLEENEQTIYHDVNGELPKT